MIAQYAAAALVNESGARAPGRRRPIPTERRPGGLQLDGRAAGAEGAHGARDAAQRARHRARLRASRRSTPPAAAQHRRARGAAAASAGACRRWRTTARWRPSSPARGRASNRGGGADVRCKGWRQEAALLMLENNLASGRGRAAGGPRGLRRDRQGGAQPGGATPRIKRELTPARGPRDAARAVGQAGRRVRDPHRRAARADRQLQPRVRVGRRGTSSASSTPPG